VLVTVLLLGVIALTLRYGGDALIADDPLPAHAQVAVMLDGPTEGVIARRNLALSLLQQGRVDHVMFAVGRVWLWGEWLPDMVRTYVERTYGADIARRTVACEMNTDSTVEEAEASRGCLLERGWTSVIVVTSQYHTRRARRIWKKHVGAPFTISVFGVGDPDYDPRNWWRNRHQAKTWLLEVSKSMWNYLIGD
jgi:uncharacterized SAM-binding protein YcdF (DUF218 family)